MNDYDPHADPDRGRDEPEPIAIFLPLTTSQVQTLRYAIYLALQSKKLRHPGALSTLSHFREILAAINQEVTYRSCAE